MQDSLVVSCLTLQSVQSKLTYYLYLQNQTTSYDQQLTSNLNSKTRKDLFHKRKSMIEDIQSVTYQWNSEIRINQSDSYEKMGKWKITNLSN